MRFDYTTIGHITVDVLEDGTRRPGGTALYSALQASRLGLRTLVLTRGVAREIEELLAPFASELELRVQGGGETTELRTAGSGEMRRQQLVRWAGPVAPPASAESSILHLAPVARETPAQWPSGYAFIGLTPQGLLRRWPSSGGPVTLGAPDADALRVAARCDAIVLSEREREHCEPLLQAALAAGATVAVTAGAASKRLLLPSGAQRALEVPPVRARDDLGAGDVFAAAFFCALAEGMGAEAAASFATAAAAVRVQGEGPSAIGDRAAVEARLRAVASAPRSGV